MQITLTADIENNLTHYAKHQGIRPELLALNVLREWFAAHSLDESSAGEDESLADYLADHIGVISSNEHIPGGAQMSKDCGKKFAEGMLKKRQNEIISK